MCHRLEISGAVSLSWRFRSVRFWRAHELTLIWIIFHGKYKQALKTAQTECPKLSPDVLVLYNNDRGQFIRKTFNNRWLKAVRAVQSEPGRQLDYTFHDIEAKAISDFEGSSRDKQIFSGHKTESQVLIYDRKVQISPTLDRPVIGEKWIFIQMERYDILWEYSFFILRLKNEGASLLLTPCLIWRKRRDSNSGTLSGRRFSRPVPSTARPHFRNEAHYKHPGASCKDRMCSFAWKTGKISLIAWNDSILTISSTQMLA